MVPKEQKLITD